MKPELVEISKFLSYVLRHRPESINVSLDEHGWINIDTLIKAANHKGKKLTKNILDEVVFTNNKQRFAYSEDGLSIKAIGVL